MNKDRVSKGGGIRNTQHPEDCHCKWHRKGEGKPLVLKPKHTPRSTKLTLMKDYPELKR